MSKAETQPTRMETLEDMLLEQLQQPVVLKDGSTAVNPDGTPMTKNQAIAMNIMNQAMKGDIKAAQYIANLQRLAATKPKKK